MASQPVAIPPAACRRAGATSIAEMKAPMVIVSLDHDVPRDANRVLWIDLMTLIHGALMLSGARR